MSNELHMILGILALVVAVFAFFTKDLNGVKNAFFYRSAFAFMVFRALLLLIEATQKWSGQ